MAGARLAGPFGGGAGRGRAHCRLLAAALRRPARGPAAKACRINLPPSIFRRLPLPKERRPSGSPSACATRCNSTCTTAAARRRRSMRSRSRCSSTQFTAYIDPTTGRPDTQIQIVIASYQLIELGTGKMVLNDMTYRACRLRHPGLAAALRRPARAARCGRSRHSSGRRRHPQPACVVLRRRDVISSDRGFSTVMRGLDPRIPIEQAMSCK